MFSPIISARQVALALAFSAIIACCPWNVSLAHAVEYLSGIAWDEPAVVTPGKGGGPPSDAVVLFDGNNLDAWEGGENWIVRDGIAICSKGNITSKAKFGDCQVHLEWSIPADVQGGNQHRGNSGLFLMGLYEIQILDSYRNKTYFDGQAGAIYKQTPPMVNAMRPPGEWNVYDVLWTAPRFKEDGSLKSPAVVTALHNGVVILNRFELLGEIFYYRPPEYTQHDSKLPIVLQDHRDPVRFRNIWVRPIKPIAGKRVSEPYLRDGDKKLPIDQAASAQ